MVNNVYDCIIIGGGASGILTAIQVKRFSPNSNILLVEAKESLAKKLKASGNGRGNLLPERDAIYKLHSHSPTLLNSYLHTDSLIKAKELWESLGLDLVLVNDAYYPRSLKAESVVALLETQLRQMNIEILLNTQMLNFRHDKKYAIEIMNAESSTKYTVCSDSLVLSCGGATYSSLGGNLDIYKLLEQKGFELIKPFPALNSLILSQYDKRLAGVKQRVGVNFIDIKSKEVLGSDVGEINFNKTGISGIPVMQLSASIYAYLYLDRTSYTASRFSYHSNKVANECFMNSNYSTYAKDNYKRIDMAKELSDLLHLKTDSFICMDFFPDISYSDFDTYIDKKLTIIQNNEDLLLSLFSESLAKYFTRMQKMLNISNKALLFFLKSWIFAIDSLGEMDKAQVSAGGVKFNNFKLESLEAENWPNLYMTGELLDCYGDCGGYNLYWANYSSQIVAKSITSHINSSKGN